ncbi:hypothetical protein BHE74_00041683 [Ensete ventricosum]|nr:hypothetical protein BHE74_00041683 [Ensete ventricosum]
MEEDRDDSSASSGIRPWGLLVLFAIFILFCLPSLLSASFGGFRAVFMKNGWDTLNFVLVLFAVLCGVLGRRNSGDDKSPSASPPKDAWYNNRAAQLSDLDRAAVDHSTRTRRMRSSSSYPDLRQEAAWAGASVAEGWQFFDDIHLYRRRSDSGSWESQSFGGSSAKAIPVVTSVIRRSPSPVSRSPPSQPPPPPPPTTAQRLPKRNLQKLPPNVVEKDAIFETRNPSSPPTAQPRQRHGRGRSLEKFPEREVEGDANPGTRHWRSRTVEDLPDWKVERHWDMGAQTPHTPHPTRPPPSPSPPPHQVKTNDKKRRGGGAKDIVSAIALFYKKKKRGSKTKRSHDDISLYMEASSSSPPRASSSSVSHHLFSHKKSKNRGFNSSSTSPPQPSLPSIWRSANQSSHPPSPPPPPPTRQYKRQAPQPPPPPPAPPQGKLDKRKEKPNLSDFPLPPPSTSFPSTWRSANQSSPPPSPPPPPPTRQYKRKAPVPPPPPPAPPQGKLDKRKEKTNLSDFPLPPPSTSLPSTWRSANQSSLPPSPPPPPPTRQYKRQAPLPPPPPPAPPQGKLEKRKEKPNLSDFPLPPSSPLLPPPPPPPLASDSQELFSDDEEAGNIDSKRFEGAAANTEENGTNEGVAVFCPSPDVNNKADLFIAGFHARLKLEKLNSIREKQRQRQQQQQEEEIMMIGSLFDDYLI